MGQFHDVTFPNEPDGYRAARDNLIKAEMELRAKAEEVASLRRSLPLGGAIKKDYVFQDLDENDVHLSSLFTPKSDNLLIYSFMYSPGGNACPACNSLLDFLNGGTPHIKENLNFAVIAKATPDELKTWSQSRNWDNITLLSSTNTSYNADYHAEDAEGSQWPLMNVFKKTDTGIHHTWASELFFAANEDGQHPRHADQIWPLWNVYDLAPNGRPDGWFPAYQYD